MVEDVATTQPIATDKPPAKGLACPRCSYDLAGQREVHPTGVCPECGLEFEWKSLHNVPPPPPWCLEHRLGKNESTLSLVRAAFGALRVAWTSPRRLWTGVTMGHPIRLAPLFVATLATLATAAVVYVLASAAMSLVAFGLAVRRNDAEQAATGQLWHRPAEFETFVREVWPMLVLPGAPWTASSGDASRAVMLAIYASLVGLIMPLSFLLLGTTMKTSKVNRLHLVRAAAYGVIYAPVPFIFVSVLTWSSLMLDLLAGWITHSAFGKRPTIGVQTVNVLYGSARFVESAGPLISFVACLVFTWSFWRRASGSYMRLPSAGFDTAILQLMVMLLIPVVAIASLSLMRHL